MSKMERAITAFGGVESGEDHGGTHEEDYKSKYEELARQLQTERVESGRLKKANEEIADLRRQLEQMNANAQTDKIMEAIPDDIRADMGEFGRGAAIIAQKAVSGQEERLNRLERQQAENAMNSFVAQIERSYPGFLESTATGGSNHNAWVKYQKLNSDTIRNAFNAMDYETLTYHIERFYREFGVLGASGGRGESAVPSPRENGGGEYARGLVQTGKSTYTQEEYEALEMRAERARENRDFATYNQISSELDRILTEGLLRG